MLHFARNYPFSIQLGLIFILHVILFSGAKAQVNSTWDDTAKSKWPPQCEVISIPSSLDQQQQPAYLYRSKKNNQALIISLHTWSGDYTQRDPLVNYCIAADINYLHPNFRGPNNRPEAAGSKQVIQDIDDAIQWAIDSLQLNKEEIHVVGVSGGGFATLFTYMKSKHAIKSFHAFVGIYNLEDWYHESRGRKNVYADHIVAFTSGQQGMPNMEEARNRSPFFMKTPIKQRSQSSLHLYCGMHDGYTGSVPISQTLELYNKVVQDFAGKNSASLVPQQVIYTLLKRRSSPAFPVQQGAFMGRDLIYHNQYKQQVELTVFDGGHEMPEGNLLKLIFSKK